MPQNNRYEQQFLDALKAVFVGAHVEGESGYINLMKIKSRYLSEGVFPRLMQDIDAACKPFEPSFREELFDKLYAFFSRYFSESGSIYFRHTAPHQNVYERVYTDDRDVMLFWKTHMLYYVKTDRLFNNMEVEVDGERFFFDVSAMELKRANEKRELTYEFKKHEKDGRLTFTVAYSEKGRKTKADEILRAINAARRAGTNDNTKHSGENDNSPLSGETLEKAFRVFEKQSEVDYFINKNAGAFLQEQFDLWLYQYLFKGESDLNEIRLKQLQALKEVAYKIIDLIARFEDELVKVWNKPKFVLNSHYVITLDKIVNPPSPQPSPWKGEGDGGVLLKRIFAHPAMPSQIAEWRDLGMLNDSLFAGAELPEPATLLDLLLATDLTGAPLYPRYRYLPLDTKYFPDLELGILALFDDIDAALDGWLVHSENYQALNTLLPKFRERVKCVHIDPPYNTETSGFLYANTYQHSSWLTMMENRIDIAQMFMDGDGSFLCHVDENEYDHLYTLFRRQDYSYLGTVVWDKRNPMMGGKGIAVQHEYIIWCSNHDGTFDTSSENAKEILKKADELIHQYGFVTDECRREFANWVRQNANLSGGEKAYQFLNNDGRVYQSVGMGWPNPNPAPEQFFVPLIHPITRKPCPIPPRGWSRSPEKMQELLSRNEIIFGVDETVQPRRKIFLKPSTSAPLSSVLQNGQRGKAELDKMGLEFSYCHPLSLYEKILYGGMLGGDGCLLDFFAGSGTTAHAVMNLNRADGGRRKYILVEMGDHFHTVILPRIKKVAFSDRWKDGKAVFSSARADGLPNPSDGRGMSHLVKYYDLEQYEDTLRRARYEDYAAPLFAGSLEALTSYVFLRDLKLLDAVAVDTKQNKVQVRLENLYTGIDLAETLSCLTGRWIRRITKDAVEFEDGTTASLSAPEWEDVKPLIWW